MLKGQKQEVMPNTKTCEQKGKRMSEWKKSEVWDNHNLRKMVFFVHIPLMPTIQAMHINIL